MDEQRQILLESTLQLTNQLPLDAVSALAQGIASAENSAPSAALRAELLQTIPQPAMRAAVQRFLDTWQQHAAAVPPAAVALALHAAAAAFHHARQKQQIDLVWTGPLTAGVAMRRTDQALLQVIHSARKELLVVSFAVYKIPAISEALVAAASRQVAIRICVEAPEPSGQQMAYDTIRALGPLVTATTNIYIWPASRRPTDARGRAGVLHTKCAVADRQLLFLSSANLTDYALNLNMELGVLIQGGTEPATVAAQFDGLIAAGTLQKVQ
jgi:phosphatidylserine/phosphatidylglycerophosphate/cardiolipin synthase-like enzyme